MPPTLSSTTIKASICRALIFLFISLLAQPGSDRNASETENKKRIMRVSNDASQLGFKNPVKHRDNLFLVYLCHLVSPFMSLRQTQSAIRRSYHAIWS